MNIYSCGRFPNNLLNVGFGIRVYAKGTNTLLHSPVVLVLSCSSQNKNRQMQGRTKEYHTVTGLTADNFMIMKE